MKLIRITFTNIDVSGYSPPVIEFLGIPILFEYDESTTVGDLFRSIFNSFPEKEAFQYQDDESLFEHFILENNGVRRFFVDMNVNLSKVVTYIKPSDNTLLLYWFSRPGGGYAVMEEDGLRFEIRTNEENHKYVPHVHAKYGNQEISIKISDAKIIAGTMSGVKARRAQKLVELNREYLQRQWDDHETGFRIPSQIKLKKNEKPREA